MHQSAVVVVCYVMVEMFTQCGFNHFTETLGSRVLVLSTMSEEDLESFG